MILNNYFLFLLSNGKSFQISRQQNKNSKHSSPFCQKKTRELYKRLPSNEKTVLLSLVFMILMIMKWNFPNAKSLVLFKLNLLKFKSFIFSYFYLNFYKLEKWIKMRLNFWEMNEWENWKNENEKRRIIEECKEIYFNHVKEENVDGWCFFSYIFSS